MNPNLIFDIGMNHGEDTAHYLSRGYNVVAVEANPELVSECTTKYAGAIAAGRLTIEPFAIAEQSGYVTLWVDQENDAQSSLIETWHTKNNHRVSPIKVACTTLDHLLSKYGVPYYLEIDIEGADRNCLTALCPNDLPTYISIEAHELEYLIILWNLGYRHFKIVDQMRHNSVWPLFSNENIASRFLKKAAWYGDRIKNKFAHVRYAPGSSGPFGEETAGEWLNLEAVAYNWLHFHRGYRKRGNLNPRSWYDFHAKL